LIAPTKSKMNYFTSVFSLWYQTRVI